MCIHIERVPSTAVKTRRFVDMLCCIHTKCLDGRVVHYPRRALLTLISP